MRLELKQFDLRRIKDNRLVLIIGPRGTGKSTLLFDILCTLCDRFDFGVAMSPTLDSIIRFKQYFPDGFVFAGTMNPAFRQIGNAVPPLLAKAISRTLRKTLKDACK